MAFCKSTKVSNDKGSLHKMFSDSKMTGGGCPPPAFLGCDRRLARRSGGEGGAGTPRSHPRNCLEVGHDEAEQIVNLVAEDGDHADRDDGNETDEQAVLDQSRAILVLHKTC